MDAKTKDALLASIRKWEEIVAGTGTDLGMDNCALCQMFAVDDDPEDPCGGCPVKEKTGRSSCHESPYVEFRRGSTNGRVTDTRSKALAQAELDFLRSLLPESDPAPYCSYGHATKALCDCGPIAGNE